MSKWFAIVAISTLSLLYSPAPVQAYPKYQKMRIYFSDPGFTNEVGMRVISEGAYECDFYPYGSVTPYSYIEWCI